jgi:hypothetical protein
MIPQFNFADFTFKGVSLFTVNDPAKNAKALADLLEKCSSKNIIGFDRAIWSHLSSGQMPSQLFSFPHLTSLPNSCTYESFFIVFWNDLNGEESFLQESYLSLLESFIFNDVLEQSGNLGQSYEEEEDFQGGLYGMVMSWQDEDVNFPDVRNMKTFLLGDKQDIQFSFGYNLSSAEDWLDDNLKTDELNQGFIKANEFLSGGFFYLPSRDLLTELRERVEDKERIHLDQQITGVRC